MDASSSPARPAGPGARPLLRVRSLPDLLALVPVVLGFEPSESLVVVAVAGPRTGFHLRVDLPPRSRPAVVAALADQVAMAALAQDCARVAVIAFTARDARRVDPVLRTVGERLADAGVDVLDLLRADGARYWSLTCTDPRCCASEGTPYDPAASTVRAEAALAGVAVAPDRAALAARLAAVSGDLRDAMQAATRVAEREVVGALGLRGVRALARPPERSLRAGAEVGAARVERLIDAVLTDAVDDEGAGEPSAVERMLTEPVAAALSVWCSITCFRDLAWSHITRDAASMHLALWSAVARRVVPPYEPAVLSLAGFAAWLSGDGATAWCAADRALGVDPGYSMAGLLRETLARCLPPDVWTPPPREIVLPRPVPNRRPGKAPE